MSWEIRTTCRLCYGASLETVLTLAPTPPANELVHEGDPEQELIPLYLAQCMTCGHVQLPVVVDPARLFSNYVYVSGTSPSFVEHFRQYAERCIETHHLKAGDLVVDVGSNDGTLLRCFKERGMRVLGVDPAKEIAKRATESGIETWPLFFSRKVAAEITKAHGPAHLVVANNVFAHADDLGEIALAAQDLLVPTGAFVFEVQYLVDLIEKTLFDMCYHEHLSYHSIGPLKRFFDHLWMSLVDVERVGTHGGSIRCTVLPQEKRRPTKRFDDLLSDEKRFMGDHPFWKLKRCIDVMMFSAEAFFIEAEKKKWKVAGFGAPAKFTTLAYQIGITRQQIAYVVDDSPWKQGLFTPGTRIPIVSAARLKEEPPDRVVVFAWNFAEQIAAKHPELAGKLVVPLPTYREI